MKDELTASQMLMSEIIAHGLERNALELELLGYTVIEPSIGGQFTNQIRNRIVKLANEENRHQIAFLDRTGQRVWKLMARGRVFERAVLEPKLVTLMTYLLGNGCILSSLSANIIRESAGAQQLHTDSALLPDPLPYLAQVATAIWCCDDFSEQSGGTRVVPGSHRYCRRPRIEENRAGIVLNCPKGSIVVMHGNLWHASGPKTTPGSRVGLIACFMRMHLRPQEQYSQRDIERIVARNPPRLARLLGTQVPYGWARSGPNMDLMMNAMSETLHG